MSASGIDNHLTATRIGGARPDSGSRRITRPPKIEPRAAMTKVIVTGAFGCVELAWSAKSSSGTSEVTKMSAP